MPNAILDKVSRPMSCNHFGQARFPDGSVRLAMKVGDHDFAIKIDADHNATLTHYRERDAAEDCADDPAMQEKLKAVKNRERIESETPEREPSRWELAGGWVRAATSPRQVAKYLRAVGSRALRGPVSHDVLNFRHACCHGETLDGVKVGEPCANRKVTDHGTFCQTCGCPEWKQADLTVNRDEPNTSKLACPDLACPIGRWAEV